VTAAAFMESDASTARLIHDNEVHALSPLPEPPASEESGEAWRRARQGVEATADWIGERLAGRRRLDELVMGVEESLCIWMAAPGATPSVVAAALRRRQGDWAEQSAATLIQPLARDDARGKEGAPSSYTGRLLSAVKRNKQPGARSAGHSGGARRLSVLQMHDGPTRLLLDSLDSRNIRVGVVSTLWHVAGRAWIDENAPPDVQSLTAVVLLEREGRIVWSWHAGPDLKAAGAITARGHQAPPRRAPEALVEAERRAEAEHPSERPIASPEHRAAQNSGRLTLDWLAWSAQIGSSPERVIVVGEQAGAFASALEARWSGARIESHEEDDAIGATMLRLTRVRRAGRPETDDPMRCVVDLSTRPSRAHRRLGVLSAAAVLLLAGGLVGLGVQMQSRTAEMDRARREARTTKVELIQGLPGAPQNARVRGLEVQSLRTMLNELRAQTPEAVDPPDPRPILDELVRFASAIEPLQGADAATLDRVQIGEDPPSAVVQATDFATPETVRSRLTGSEGWIDWRGRIEGSPPNLVLRLNGTWKEPSS
jgi:hypothetical protein